MQCHLCGQWLKWTGGLHLKFGHPDWTITDYRRAFELTDSQVTMAAESREMLRAMAVERLQQARIGSPLAGGHGLQRGPWRSLVDRRSDLAAQLNPQRNGTLNPALLGVWSSEQVWWCCPQCGCEWQATVMSRASFGSGCPKCGSRSAARARHGRRMPLKERALAALRPDLVAELHPIMNDEFDPRTVGVWSRRRVWWLLASAATTGRR